MEGNMNYQEINANTFDRWVEAGWEWGRPVNHETCLRAKNGDWQVVLTPTEVMSGFTRPS